MIGRTDRNASAWFVPPELDLPQPNEDDIMTITVHDYDYYFPERWDRYLFDIESK